MARSCVLRRSALANWRRRQWVSGAYLPRFFPDLPLRQAPVLARFFNLPSSIAPGNPQSRHFSTGKTLGTAVLDDFNNNGNNATPGAFSSATGIFSSQRRALRMPQDPCMDITRFVLAEKEQITSRAALIDAQSGKSLTYDDLLHTVYSVELGLVGMGLRQGDVVMLLSRNSVHYPVIFLATTSVGGVMATVSPHCSPAECRKQAQSSGARFIIVEEEFVDRVADLGVPLVIIEHGDKVKVGSTEVSFSELLASDPTCSSAPETKICQDDPALIVYTSGSTGACKPVLLTHKSIMAQILQLASMDSETVDTPGTHLCCLPMAHVFGLVVVTLQQLYRGGTVVLKPKLEVSEVVDLIDVHNVSHLYALPNAIANLLKIMTTTSSTSTSSLSSLQRITSGGAPLNKDLVHEFGKLLPDASFVQIYGLTEATGAIALSNLNEDHDSGSVGTLLSGIEAKVVNESKEAVGPGVQGELHVRGPNVMKGGVDVLVLRFVPEIWSGYAGYVSGPEATWGLEADGWLSTGDVVSIDEQGKMFVMDRIKEAVYKAQQVVPGKLEAALLSHPCIVDAAFVPAPGEQVGVAFVVQSGGSSLTEDEVKEFIHQRVDGKNVRQVQFVSGIPRSVSGKIQRNSLLQDLSSSSSSTKEGLELSRIL